MTTGEVVDAEEIARNQLEPMYATTRPRLVHPSLSMRESESMYYFRTLAAQDFGGYLRTDFWGSFVVQKSLVRPALRYALTALSDAHKEWVTNPSVNLSPKTLAWYGRAIRMTVLELQQGRGWRTYIDSLYCCIVLYYFELLNKDTMAADLHCENALHLLREWHSSSVDWPPAELDDAHRMEFYQVLYTIGRLDVDRLVANPTPAYSERNFRIIHDGLRPVTEGSIDVFALSCHFLLVSRLALHFLRVWADLDDAISEDVRRRQAGQCYLDNQVRGVSKLIDALQTQIDDTSLPGRQKMVGIYTMRLYLVAIQIRVAETCMEASRSQSEHWDENAELMLRYADQAISFHCLPPLRQGFLPQAGIVSPLERLASVVTGEDNRARAHAILERLQDPS